MDRRDNEEMSQVQVHVHLVYVGKDQFQLTINIQNQTPMIEVMTFGDLQKAIPKMKPGAKIIRFANSMIDFTDIPSDVSDKMRRYFQEVYRRYVQARADGRDLDAELREMAAHPDPTNGSGGFCLN